MTKDDSGNSALKPQAGSSGVDIMASVRWCSSCGTNFLLPRVKFREHYTKCKEYYRKIALDKYNAKIDADAALAASSPKERSIDELSKQPVAAAYQELVEPQPTVPTSVVATNSKKRPSKHKKSNVQKEPSQNPAANVLTQTIEPIPVSVTSSSLSNGSQISVKSSNAAGSSDKKRPSNPIVATKFPKKRKVQKESFHNPVANTDISSNAAVANNRKNRPSSPIVATKNQKAQKETFQNPVANNTAHPNVSSSPNSIGNEISATSLPIPSSFSQLSNCMNTSLTRETVKQRTNLCSHCSFSISNMQVMMTHFGRMHPSQVVEFTELIMSKFKMKDNN